MNKVLLFYPILSTDRIDKVDGVSAIISETSLCAIGVETTHTQKYKHIFNPSYVYKIRLKLFPHLLNI